jgi:preprotein translocase subunit SecF
VIRSFSIAMIWGIFVATYSSIFICSPMLIYLGLRNEDADKAAAQRHETERKAATAASAKDEAAEAPSAAPTAPPATTEKTPAPARKAAGKRAKTRPA